MQYLKRKFRKIPYPRYKRGNIPLDAFVADGFDMFYRITEEESEFIMDNATDEEVKLLMDCFSLEELNYSVIKKALIVLNTYLDMFETRRKPLIPFSYKKKYRKIRGRIGKWCRHQLFVCGLPGGFPDMDSKRIKKRTEHMEREFEREMSQKNNQTDD